jgi:allophanate hydrolase subunit 2
MDWVRHRLALALAGNTAAAFEVGIAGAEFLAEGAVRLAVTGPGFAVRIAGAEPRTVEPPARLVLLDGERLSIVPGARGMWAYVAVAGIDLGPPVLGSWSTNQRTGMGARDLAAPFPCATAEPEPPALFADPYADAHGDDGPVALLPGPQSHLFAPEVVAAMADEPYRLTAQLDRMGYRLQGPRLPAATHDIISDGIVEGAIQVPGDEQPIVLLADRAPTGGYPKIAIVAAADRPRLAQRRPGEEVRFRWATADDARARRREIAALLAAPAPRVRTGFSPEFLAAQNLIGGVVSAQEDGPQRDAG